MKVHKKWAVLLLGVVFILSLMFLMSCGDDDDDSTGPSTSVAGVWEMTGTVTSNTCILLQDDPDYAVGAACSDSFTVTQNGTNLTGVDSSGETYAGTVDGDFFSLTLTNPPIEDVGICTISGGSEMAVNRTTEIAGSGTMTITLSTAAGDCSILGIPCSVVCTGSWARTTTAKRIQKAFGSGVR